jgi:hypothetical protein
MKNKILVSFALMFLVVIRTYAADFQVGIGAGGDFGLVFTSFDSNLPEPAKGESEEALKNIDMNKGGGGFF